VAATASSREPITTDDRTIEQGAGVPRPLPLAQRPLALLAQASGAGVVNDFNGAVVLSRLIAATERLAVFPESGRSVPEFQSPVVGEVILRPHRAAILDRPAAPDGQPLTML
jgi:hypothetical protein